MTRLSIICIGSIAIGLAFAGQSYAQIDAEDVLGIWLLDEGTGDTTEDASGNGNDGTLMGAPDWVAGNSGEALGFRGAATYVDCGNAEALNVEVFSVSFWCNIAATQGWNHMISRGSHVASGTPGSVNWGVMMVNTEAIVLFETFNDTGWTGIRATSTVGEWHHVVATFDGDTMQLYHDGVLASSTSGAGVLLDPSRAFVIGARSDSGGAGGFFNGSIDEVGYFGTILSLEDVEVIMNDGLAGITGGRPLARRPDPEDGGFLEQTWGTLSWSPGDFAVSHDVYLGENFDDVNDGAADTFVGNVTQPTQIIGFAGFPFPNGLVPGTTYYWRIDEVNDADPNSPWQGDVWSFSIPPKTAYSPDPIDGAGFVDLDAALSWTPGFGAKLHTVYIGDSFEDVNNAAGGVPWATATYKPSSPLEPEKVYYWRVDEFDPPVTHKGDIWSFTTPGAVGNPQQANGATGVSMVATLNWTPADTAASSDLYFGADADAVKNASAASPEYIGNKALGSENHDPGKLVLGVTYYWRVDAVYPDKTVKGLLWSLTTADFLLVDDFESYNDIDPPDDASNRIFDKWIDGFGTTTNGALVGNDLPPYAEQTIVHGGAQSMIYRYDNAGRTSEATLTLVWPRDWTQEGVTKLRLWVRGDGANAADRVYISLNGTAVVYHDDASATQLSGWNEWVIDLAAFDVDLTNVNTITIGGGTKNAPAPGGGAGTMYFDEIVLTR